MKETSPTTPNPASLLQGNICSSSVEIKKKKNCILGEQLAEEVEMLFHFLAQFLIELKQRWGEIAKEKETKEKPL